MYNKIVDTLKPLDVELAFQEFNGEADEYIIFDIYNEYESDFADDENLSIEYHITINYWFKSMKNINKYTDIKKLMKASGFKLKSIKSLNGKGFRGKNLDFIYEKTFVKEGN